VKPPFTETVDSIAIGRKGGTANAEAHDHEHFRAAGKKGGAAVKAKYGNDYYRAMAQQRWDKQKASQS
jgi:general stress protein YciG